MNSETMNGTIRSMLGTMLQHLSALPVHMLRQVFFGGPLAHFLAVFVLLGLFWLLLGALLRSLMPI